MTEEDNRRIFYGDKLYKRNCQHLQPLIEYIIYERDFCYIHADEGIGKSTLGQQWLHNLTTATPFLGIYPCPKKCNALWVMGEKTKEDHWDRTDNMKKVYNIDDSKWALYDSMGDICLDLKEDAIKFVREIDEPGIKYDIIFIDSLYNFCDGDLNNNMTATHWTRNVRAIARKYDAAVVAFGHVAKDSYFQGDKKAVVVRKNKSPFGAKQWGAFFNVIYELEYDYDNDVHTLHRRKDNRGICVKDLTLRMTRPQEDSEGRLGYTLLPEDEGQVTDSTMSIILFLHKHGECIYPDIYIKAKLPMQTFHWAVNKLIANKQVIKEERNGKIFYKLSKPLQ